MMFKLGMGTRKCFDFRAVSPVSQLRTAAWVPSEVPAAQARGVCRTHGAVWSRSWAHEGPQMRGPKQGTAEPL